VDEWIGRLEAQLSSELAKRPEGFMRSSSARSNEADKQDEVARMYVTIARPSAPMSDVFISYAQEDRAAAARVADAMTANGWSVWWDRNIPVGRSYSEEIERELDAARCVVVLWSKASIKSQWVQSEAAEGASRRILVPVCIEDVRPPLEFRRLQTATLLDTAGGMSQEDLRPCVAAVRYMVQPDVAASKSSGNQRGKATQSRDVAQRQENRAPVSSHKPLKLDTDKPDVLGQSNRNTGFRAPGRATGRARPILLISTVVLLVMMWLAGFALHVGGGLIHLLLVIAVIVTIIAIAKSRPANRVA
jgi:hypothetical protein